MREYWVYILQCNDGSYYTGMTNNLEERFRQHQEGICETCYTYSRRPVELVFHHCFGEVDDAIRAEKQIQGWSRTKKEALIAGNIPLLHGLSVSTEKLQRMVKKNASSPLAPRQARGSFRSA